MIRKATMQDMKIIHGMLADYGRQGLLISRPLSQLYDHVRDFSVFIDPEKNLVAGCCALQFCWEDLAEIRSLAVRTSYWRKGVGRLLVENALQEARSFQVKKVFTLTYQPVFFQKQGFDIVDRAELPLKIWADCIICVKFPDCDEIAMMKALDQEPGI
ncbi:MAG: N-acetyltransferase [Thermodesulfobacteriota bacterium]